MVLPLLVALRIGLCYPRLGTVYIKKKERKKSSKQRRSNMFTLKKWQQLANWFCLAHGVLLPATSLYSA